MISKMVFGFVRLSAFVAGVLLCASANASAQEPTVTPLHTFTGAAGEGIYPNARASLVEGDGSFYGVTQSGGAAGLGTIFRMTPDGTATTLHSFTDGTYGFFRHGTLIEARDGNLYGATQDGGSAGQGTIFRMTPGGTFTVMHTFAGMPDGSLPVPELVEASDGYLYGTTAGGGAADRGTVFKISLEGALTTLHSFTDTPDGAVPHVPLVQGADGNFYGLTSRGGPGGSGAFFRMTPGGTVAVVLSPFGEWIGRLVPGVDGNFYSIHFFPFQGQGPSHGAVYRVTPSGVFSVLAPFGGEATNLAVPFSLVQASDTYLYGTALGTCILIDPPPVPPIYSRCFDSHYFRMDLEGHVEFLKRFELGRSVTGVLNPLIEARDGNLYGTWGGVSETDSGPYGAVVRISNYTNCNDKLTVHYEAGTLYLGFTLMTKSPATWRTWLAVPGPPVLTAQLWSVPIPAVEPAVFTSAPIPAFPHIGRLFVLTALSTASGAVCADWKMVDTGAAVATVAE
jgi:uncharacterized repeat protein (TIGR03803 family)